MSEVVKLKPKGRPKSVVNKVTEYGALFNELNAERAAKGLPPLKTAMEVLIEAMQSDELDIRIRHVLLINWLRLNLPVRQ